MSKKRYFTNELYESTVHNLRNKYFNLFRAQFKWNGLNYRQEKYIMKKFWDTGTVAAFKIPIADELGFAPWALQEWDQYGLPEKILLINERNSPLIPSKVQVVDKDACIGYIQRNEKGIHLLVDWYIERIAQVEIVINTNLQLQKIPFLIPVEENDTKVKDIVTRILNNEIVIFAEGVDPTIFTAVQTGAPYIIDKLTEYKTSLVNELNTYLGINNSGQIQKAEQLQLSEVNSNNDEINDSQNVFIDCLKEWCDNIKETFGITISVEPTSQPVITEGQIHNGNKPGPEGGNSDEE